jgi:hypothetical protein
MAHDSAMVGALGAAVAKGPKAPLSLGPWILKQVQDDEQE